MNKLQLSGAVCACSLALFSHSVTAAVVFDANVTPDVIFGSGNLNGSFTVDQNNGVELGLRGKLRFNSSGLPENTFNSNGDGTYNFDAGVAPTKSSPTAVWSFEWSINSDYSGTVGRNLDALTYVLGIDSDPGAGTTWSTFDPINVTFADHPIGNNSTIGNNPTPPTPPGTGLVATTDAEYAALIAGYNVAQNSWQAHWFLGSGFDPTVDGQYDFYLAAFNGTTQLARTDMSIIVGAGAAVPIPAAAWLFGSALGLLGWIRRKVS